MKLVIVLIGLLACARLPIVGPMFAMQDKTVYGMLVTVERNEDYEGRCHWLCRAFGGESGPRAYEAQVTDSLGQSTWFMFFAPEGNVIPHVGQVAFWRLRSTDVVNSSKSTMYSQAHETVLQLWSDEDIRP